MYLDPGLIPRMTGGFGGMFLDEEIKEGGPASPDFFGRNFHHSGEDSSKLRFRIESCAVAVEADALGVI